MIKTSREKRKRRIRKKIQGTPERPRLSVYRSLRRVYAQVIDDLNGRTLVAADSLKDAKGAGNKAAAAVVGELVAKRAMDKNIKQVTFDRNGFLYHGVVQVVAEAARKQGLDL